MQSDDQAFLEACLDPDRRVLARQGWRRTRRLSFALAVVFLGMALLALVLRIGWLGGLCAAVSAINYAGASAADLKIKLALLVERGLAVAQAPTAKPPLEPPPA